MMFKRVTTLLLSGEFICQNMYKSENFYLSSDVNRDRVNAFLGQLDLALTKTVGGSAWYVAHRHSEDGLRQNAKTIFTEVKQFVRPIVSFIDLVMQATKRDDAMVEGARLEVNALMAGIDANPSLRNQLSLVSNLFKGVASETSLRSMLDKIVKKLKDESYLKVLDQEREIYVVTGKIEYFDEVVNFLVEHESLTDGADDEAAMILATKQPVGAV